MDEGVGSISFNNVLLGGDLINAGLPSLSHETAGTPIDTSSDMDNGAEAPLAPLEFDTFSGSDITSGWST